MTRDLTVAYQVVYYAEDGRHIYWPADHRSEVLAEKLREARERRLNAWLSQAEAPTIPSLKAASGVLESSTKQGRPRLAVAQDTA